MALLSPDSTITFNFLIVPPNMPPAESKLLPCKDGEI
jgi:hypothetical protein